MILNTRIWKETVNAAKAAASDSPAWLRAIERAVIEIERSKYWSFDGSIAGNGASGFGRIGRQYPRSNRTVHFLSNSLISAFTSPPLHLAGRP